MDQHNRVVGRFLSSKGTGFNRLYFISGLSHRNQSSQYYLMASRNLFLPSPLTKDVVDDLCVPSLGPVYSTDSYSSRAVSSGKLKNKTIFIADVHFVVGNSIKTVIVVFYPDQNIFHA